MFGEGLNPILLISCQYLPFAQTEDIWLKSAGFGKNPPAMFQKVMLGLGSMA